MTVCLGIACDGSTSNENPKFVLVTDQMVSTVTSSSLSRKIWKLSESWYVMLAGNDVGAT